MCKLIKYILLLINVFYLYSCEKFLVEKPSSRTMNISTLSEMQALMDAGNKIYLSSHSALVEMATDNFFLGPTGFNSSTAYQRDIYLWEKTPTYTTEGDNSNWMNPFHIVAVMNSILDELPNVRDNAGLNPNNIKGSALFHRAFAYHNLVQVYTKAYDKRTADTDLGLPIRKTADINQKNERHSLSATLDFIEKDLTEAVSLLPNHSEYKSRPNKASAHALLARFYLYKGEYEKALEHANQSLNINNLLIDFNILDNTKAFPIDNKNDEILFYAVTTNAMLNPTRECFVDTILLNSYHEDDLRKSIFFRRENNGYYTFKGSYSGSNALCFLGLTVSEILLIKAEAECRLGNQNNAMASLNHLLSKRIKKDKFKPFEISNSDELLGRILEERRKELLFRGTRWSDLKRLNKEEKFQKTLIRKHPINGSIYTLPPNDLRYVFLIPERIISKSGLEQNPR